MLKFVNRRGLPITRECWEGLLRKRGYQEVARAEKDKVAVEASWLGVACDWQARPAYFVVRALGRKKLKGDDGPPVDLVEPRWFDTRDEAVAGFVRLAEEMDVLEGSG